MTKRYWTKFFMHPLSLQSGGWDALDHETLHPTGPDLHFIDHVAYDFYRRPFACRGAMPDGVVITEERPAKDGWNLADLDSPLFLLGGYRFLLWSTPRWGERRVRDISPWLKPGASSHH